MKPRRAYRGLLFLAREKGLLLLRSDGRTDGRGRPFTPSASDAGALSRPPPSSLPRIESEPGFKRQIAVRCCCQMLNAVMMIL